MARVLAQLGVRAVDDHGREVDASTVTVEDFHLWPCNVRAWCVWGSVQTQWRTGMAGATGLDYTAVWTEVCRQVPRRKRDETFEAIQGMERVTLSAWAEARERERKAREKER